MLPYKMETKHYLPTTLKQNIFLYNLNGSFLDCLCALKYKTQIKKNWPDSHNVIEFNLVPLLLI